MTTFFQFVVLGLGTGAIYALLAQGLVAIFRGSGVLNFAHGAIAMFSAFIFVVLRQEHGWGVAPALVAAIVVASGIGIVVYQVLMRRLNQAAVLTRVIATLGVLLILQASAVLIWSGQARFIDSFLPTEELEVGGVTITLDRLLLLGVAAVITLGLWAGYRFTTVGLATGAVAENRRAAAALGWSPDRLATANWAVGAAIAAVAGAFIAPVTGVQAETMTMMVIPALAAALIGGLYSFPLTLIGAVTIGVGQSLVGNYVHQQGAAESLPLVVIVAYLVLRGKSLPTRGYVGERLAALGTGVLAWRRIVPVVAAVVALTLTVFPIELNEALAISLAAGTILLSVVVLTGYTGQLSLAQFAIGGVGALIAGQLVHGAGWPFPLAMAAGVVGTIPVGLVIGTPALRTRGVNLAIVTLALGVTLQALFFNNADFTGGSDGTPVGPQNLFGIDIDPVAHSDRYAALVLAFFLLAAYVVARLRRSRAGRRLIAVRGNERAAAALGISVVGAKLYAFALAAGLAAIGGVLLGFQDQTIIYSTFSPLNSILAVAYTVVGGVGFVLGALAACTIFAGGIGSWIIDTVFSGSVDSYLGLIGGVALLLVLLADPNGLVSLHDRQFKWVHRRVLRRSPTGRKVEPAEPGLAATTANGAARHRVQHGRLEVSGLTVRFGGVTAVSSLSLSVESGQIVGLIGPNGAGKTTVIDAVTGFVSPAAGRIALSDKEIGSWPVHRRARVGVSRSFQSLELFDDITLLENFQAASDARDRRAYVTNLFFPDHTVVRPAVAAAIQEFGLEPDLSDRPSELPYGRRRLAAVARAIAAEPSILLLDEPAAGLDPRETAELAVFVRNLARNWGIGILLVEHDMSFVMSVCDRITVLDFGRKIAEGTESEIRRDPAVIAAYLGEQEPADTAAEQPVSMVFGETSDELSEREGPVL